MSLEHRSSSANAISSKLQLLRAEVQIRDNANKAREHLVSAEYAEAAEEFLKALDALRAQEFSLAEDDGDHALKALGGGYSEWDDLSLMLSNLDLYENWQLSLRRVHTYHEPLLLLGAMASHLLEGDFLIATSAWEKASEWAQIEADSDVVRLINDIKKLQTPWQECRDALHKAIEGPRQDMVEDAHKWVATWTSNQLRCNWLERLRGESGSLNGDHQSGTQASLGTLEATRPRLLGRPNMQGQPERLDAVNSIVKFLSATFRDDQKRLQDAVLRRVKYGVALGTPDELKTLLRMLPGQATDRQVDSEIRTLKDQQMRLVEHCRKLAEPSDQTPTESDWQKMADEHDQKMNHLSQWLSSTSRNE